MLRELTPRDWDRPTTCGEWAVREVVAHMLGDLLGRVSAQRDEYRPDQPLPDETLPTFIDRINEEWVRAARRLSPRLLMELYATNGVVHDEQWASLPANQLSESVSWAGIHPAPVWFDAARDLTEYWVHERQVREAVGRPGGFPEMSVVLDIFARGLPYTLAGVDLGSTECIAVIGDPLGAWTLVREAGSWWIRNGTDDGEPVMVIVAAEELWRRWTRQAPFTAPAPSTPETARDAVLAHVAIIHSSP